MRNLTIMSHRGWVGWVAANRRIAAGIGIAVVLALIGVVAVAAGGGDDDKDDSAAVAVDTGDDSTLPGAGEPGTESTTTVAGQAPIEGQPTTTAAATKSVTLPGQTSPAPACTPKDVKGTGISKTEVVIGQIVSDVSVLPAQLYPNYEGLQAYVNVVNQAGGVCGRKLRIEYSNDQSNPATHEYESMTHKVFAFVANSSLMDNTDYETDAPFNPFRRGRS